MFVFKVDIVAVETPTIIPDIEEKIILDAFNDDVNVTTSISVELIITFALREETLIVDAVKSDVLILVALMLVADIVLPDTVE